MEKKKAYFDNRIFTQSLDRWMGFVEAYEDYIMTLHSMKRDAKTLEEVEEWFVAETGIKNPELAADAMMLKREYKKALRLYDEANVIDPDTHIQIEKGEIRLNSDFYSYLQEQATTYYPEDCSKYVEQVETALRMLNSVPPIYRRFQFNSYDQKYKVNHHDIMKGIRDEQRAKEKALKGLPNRN